MESTDPVVIMLSGGINSLVAAMRALSTGETHFLYCDCGHSAAAAETRSVRRMADALAAKLHIVKLPSPAELSAIHSPGATPAAFGEESASAGRPLPGAMLSKLGIAQQLARRLKATSIVCGASEQCSIAESDRGPEYADPQSSRVFFHAACIAMERGASGKLRVELDLPLIDMTRSDIILAGGRIGAPFDLTWSCHLGGERPCGSCPGCSARTAAFGKVGMVDSALQTSR